MSRQIKNIGILLCTLFFIFIIGEFITRSTNRLYKNELLLMFSSHTFQLDQNEAVRFEPNKNIRTVLVSNKNIEYDVTFDTNNYGFVDDKIYIYMTTIKIKNIMQ